MFDLTKYRNIFGEPHKGVHSFRVFGLAAFDLGLTLVASWVIAKYWGYNFVWTFLGLLLVGIGIHGLFGVQTQLNGWLGLNKEIKRVD